MTLIHCIGRTLVAAFVAAPGLLVAGWIVTAPTAGAETLGYTCDEVESSEDEKGIVLGMGNCAANGGAPSAGEVEKSVTISNTDSKSSFVCKEAVAELPDNVVGVKCKSGVPE